MLNGQQVFLLQLEGQSDFEACPVAVSVVQQGRKLAPLEFRTGTQLLRPHTVRFSGQRSEQAAASPERLVALEKVACWNRATPFLLPVLALQVSISKLLFLLRDQSCIRNHEHV